MSEDANSMNTFEDEEKNNPVNERENEEENQEDAEFYEILNRVAEEYDIFETEKCLLPPPTIRKNDDLSILLTDDISDNCMKLQLFYFSESVAKNGCSVAKLRVKIT